MKIIVFTVTNDLTYDQRMHRICNALHNAGYQVILVGRLRTDSVPIRNEPYRQYRIKCFFQKGKFFYLEINLRLFFYLLFQKVEIIGSIDLDTLLPCYLISNIKKCKIVFDAHEHFTEVIEVVNRPFTKWVWSQIENKIVPKLKYAYTVSENLKNLFSKTHGVKFDLIRNISVYEEFLPVHKPEKFFIYAGAVNEGRGIKEIILAMQHIDAKLIICGKGDIYDQMVFLCSELKLNDKIKFLGYVHPEALQLKIRDAYAGFLLLENKGLSYYYSLANKFFDYMHAGIPQITINFPEYSFINNQIEVASLIPLDVSVIISSANKLLYDVTYYNKLSENAKIARLQYNWQQESEKLVKFYNNII